MALPIIQNAYIPNKKVIVRTGFDVPVDDSGKILDISRIEISVPTIKYLLEHSAKQIIIVTHLGRPKKQEDKYTTDNLAITLSKLIDHPVKKVDDFGENGIPDDKIIMLENLRFDPREKSKDVNERDEFGKIIASLGDLYVNDSFSTSHRDHSSMTSIPKFIPGCVGLSVENEIKTITDNISNPRRPFVSIVGGLKADKLNTISNLLHRVDKLFICGALAFTVLHILGKNTGISKVDAEGAQDFKHIIDEIKDNPKVFLPVDCVIADDFKADANIEICSVDEIKSQWMALDIGPKSIVNIKNAIAEAGTVIWNGPIGVFEFEKFSHGTVEIAESMASSKAITIIGGGDSGSAVDHLGLQNRMTLVSSGGGAFLELFEGKELVAIKALEKTNE